MTRSLEKKVVVKTNENDAKKSDLVAKTRAFSLFGWPIIVFLSMVFIHGDEGTNILIVIVSGLIGLLLGVYFGKKTNDWFSFIYFAIWAVIFAISSGMFK